MGGSTEIKLVTLNTHGLKGNALYIENIVQLNDIIFLAERWLLDFETFLLDQISSSHVPITQSGQKHESGRPFGGHCFFVKNTLSQNVNILHKDEHILAIEISLGDSQFIIIGIYLPAFQNNSTSLEKYEISLASINSIINQYIHQCEIIIMGDFQSFPNNIYDTHERCHSSRNNFSSTLQHFLVENEFDLLDVTNGTGPNITYHHATLQHSSYIDHIAVSKHSSLNNHGCKVINIVIRKRVSPERRPDASLT